MKGEFKATLTITKNEREVISELRKTLEKVFRLDFEETPENLFEIMYAISIKNSRAYLDKGTVMEIKYEDE